jgi:lysozyme
MKISQLGINLIKRFEGCRLESYPDVSPKRIPTVGYGHTGASVMLGQVITQERADELLRGDLEKFEDLVTRMVKVPLTQGQADALISFAYNCGPANLRASTLLKKLNVGDYCGAARQFNFWNHAGAETLPGLTLRRAAERALFESA